jgi:uncharacterized protein (TIGR02145 family)
MQKKHYFFTLLLATMIFVPFTTSAQVTIGSVNPPPAHSVLYLDSNDRGLRLPHLTTAQRNAINISDPSSAGLMIFNTERSSIEVFDGLHWLSIPSGTIVHGLRFLRISATEYTEFLPYNLGANPHLTIPEMISPTNILNPEALGYLFQWGRNADGHQVRTSLTSNTAVPPASIDSEGRVMAGHAAYGRFVTSHNAWRTQVANQAWNSGDGLNPVKTPADPCPDGWRIPTAAEWQAVFAYNDWRCTAQGCFIRARHSGDDNQGDWWGTSITRYDATLFLPAAGRRNFTNGTIGNLTAGYYWSSEAQFALLSWHLHISSSPAWPPSVASGTKSFGLSVRCIAE